MRKFEQITDEELKLLVEKRQAYNETRTLDNFKNMVELVFETTGLNNILHKSTRLINGVEYSWHIWPNTFEEGAYLADWFISKLLEQKITELNNDLQIRLEKLPEEEKLLRLKAELEELELKREDQYFDAGYWSQKSGKHINNYCQFDLHNKKPDYERSALGAAWYYHEQAVLKSIKLLQNEFDHVETNLVKLEACNYQLVFLKTLGVLDFLKDKYADLSLRAFAKLVGSVMGWDGSPDTVRNYMDGLFHARNSSAAKEVYTDDAIAAVIQKLVEIGFKGKRFKDIVDKL